MEYLMIQRIDLQGIRIDTDTVRITVCRSLLKKFLRGSIQIRPFFFPPAVHRHNEQRQQEYEIPSSRLPYAFAPKAKDADRRAEEHPIYGRIVFHILRYGDPRDRKEIQRAGTQTAYEGGHMRHQDAADTPPPAAQCDQNARAKHHDAEKDAAKDRPVDHKDCSPYGREILHQCLTRHIFKGLLPPIAAENMRQHGRKYQYRRPRGTGLGKTEETEIFHALLEQKIQTAEKTEDHNIKDTVIMGQRTAGRKQHER